MKKEYIKPETEVIKHSPILMAAESIPWKQTTDDTSADEAKPFNGLFDDDFDENNI